jgi:hypothetical protein
VVESLGSERARLVVLAVALPFVFGLVWLTARLRDRIPGVPRVIDERPGRIHPVDLAMLWSAYRHHLSPRTAYRTEILHLARTGAVTIIPVGPVSEPEDFELHQAGEPTDETDQRFVTFLFPERGRAQGILLSTLRPRGMSGRYLEGWWGRALSRVGSSLQRMLIDLRAEAWAAFAVLLGTMSLVPAMAPHLSDLGALPALPYVEAGAGRLLTLWILPSRLPRRERRRMQRWAAFRRYLRGFPSVRESPAAGIVIWEEYLEDATALGVAGTVERQIRGLTAPPPWNDAPEGPDGATWFRHLWRRGPRATPGSLAGLTGPDNG